MTRLVKGCNYHWIKAYNKAMRFVLKDLKGNFALLITRTTHKEFWVNINEITFIDTPYNIAKADKIEEQYKKASTLIGTGPNPMKTTTRSAYRLSVESGHPK